jgi:DNA-directed RNA polymerase alpha subunit
MRTQDSLLDKGIISDDLLQRIEAGGNNLECIGIDAIDFSVRLHNTLRKNGINTLYKLIHCSERDLFEMRNVGVGSLEEIRYRISDYAKDSLGINKNVGSEISPLRSLYVVSGSETVKATK